MYKMLAATFTTNTNSATPTSHAKRASVIGTLPRKWPNGPTFTGRGRRQASEITRTVPAPVQCSVWLYRPPLGPRRSYLPQHEDNQCSGDRGSIKRDDRVEVDGTGPPKQ